MAWSKSYKKSINCKNPKGFSQKAHCAGRKKRENIMKVSEFKNFVREISREKFHGSLSEASITPGNKEYFKPNMKDKDLLDLANQLIKYPHSKVKGGPQIQKYFKDVAQILGYPQKPSDVISGITLKNVSGTIDKNKIKMNKSKAPLFKMYKDGKLSMKQYGAIQKDLLKKYLGLVKSHQSLMYKSMGGPIGSTRKAAAAARRDMA
tara:strand:- start:328 stop:945 length:618 start_codon:yes stop_codon:yes gene_type:complete